MLQRILKIQKQYPHQFWLMFWGMFISSIGASMIWPFMTIFFRQRLDLSLTASTSLLMLESIAALGGSLFAGPVADRFGRKWIMVLGLVGSCLSYAFIGQASSLGVIALLMIFQGAGSSLYRVGGDAMVADIIPEEKRIDAYSIVRMINNLGVAIGPGIGGVLITVSYEATFTAAASGLGLYSLIVLFFMLETLPKNNIKSSQSIYQGSGYGAVFRDRLFMSISALFLLTAMSATNSFILLPVYVKENYGILEQQSGYFLASNAFMVVVFQYGVTQITKRYKPMHMVIIGSVFYIIGSGSILFANQFFAFLLCTMIMTVGELIISPTTNTLVANMAPITSRARYMSIYGLSWGLASGMGPVIGGFLNDRFFPKAIWIGATAMALCATAGFLCITRHYHSSAFRYDTETGR